jgi:ankyrin repeat protein
MNIKQLLLIVSLALVTACAQGAYRPPAGISQEQYILNKQLISAITQVTSATVLQLIEKGADLNARILGTTALQQSITSGHIDIARLLIAKGANVNGRNVENVSALMLAAGKGYVEIAKLLLENGAEINAQDEKGYTALMMATLKNNGADETLVSKSGETALAIAEAEEYKELVEFLKKYRPIRHAHIKETIEAFLPNVLADIIADYESPLPKTPSPSTTEKEESKEESKEPATKK